MKSVLCFGDSFTYGYNPENGGRYETNERYPGILRRILGESYLVVEEGLNGRTIAADDPIWDYRNGLKTLDMILESHAPVDIIIVMLGNNDVKIRFNLTKADICFSLECMVKKILQSDKGRDGKAPGLILVSPPRIGVLKDDFLLMYGENADAKIEGVIECYAAIAEKYKIPFIKSDAFIEPGTVDGIHLKRGDNKALAMAAAEKIKSL